MLTIQTLKDALQIAFGPHVQVEDESHLHSGHYHSTHGVSHVRINIISSQFTGLNRVNRHKKVYEVLNHAITKDQLHALAITTKTPDEV